MILYLFSISKCFVKKHHRIHTRQYYDEYVCGYMRKNYINNINCDLYPYSHYMDNDNGQLVRYSMDNDRLIYYDMVDERLK